MNLFVFFDVVVLDVIVCFVILLLLVCLVGLFLECVGIFDIGLEGKMLVVVLLLVLVFFVIGLVWIGLLVGIGGLFVLLLIYGLVLIIFCGN